MKNPLLLLPVLSLFLTPAAARAEQSQVTIGLGRPLGHLPLMVMEYYHLFEQHAAAVGEPNVKIVWQSHASTTVGSDALLAGDVDILSAGSVQAILLWSKTQHSKNEIKSLAAVSALPTVLATRNPALHSIRDLTDKDRIALSGVKVSFNALVLEMAAAREFGSENYTKLDHLTASRTAPDAMAALLSSASEIDCDFSIPPYVQMELKHPGIHAILNSGDLFGATPTLGVAITTSKFHDDNPNLVKAFVDALGDAMNIIHTDEQKTTAAYLAYGEKLPPDVLHDVLTNPQTRYALEPAGMQNTAAFMHKTGMISVAPSSWKDMFFSDLSDLHGS